MNNVGEASEERRGSGRALIRGRSTGSEKSQEPGCSQGSARKQGRIFEGADEAS